MEIEDRKKRQKKSIQLDEILSMTEEELKEFVQLSSSYQEFIITIHHYHYHDLDLSFKKIKEFILSARSIFALTLLFQKNKKFEKKQTLGQLQECKQISELNLEFILSYFYSSQDQEILTFSNSLTCFPNLTTFRLKLLSSLIIEKEYFKLLSFYQKAGNLKVFELYINQKGKFNLLEEILDGIHFLTELETFKLDLNFSNHNMTSVFEVLSDEILQLKKLKNLLIIENGNESHISKREYLKLGEILKQMNRLENLTIHQYINSTNNQTDLLVGCGLEEYFLQCSDLKFLELKLCDYPHNLIYTLETLSLMKNLETVKLSCEIRTSENLLLKQKNIDQVNGKHFSQIKSLSSLRISFQNMFGNEILEFISELKPLKNLKELSISFIDSYSFPNFQQEKSIVLEDLVTVMKNLKIFSINVEYLTEENKYKILFDDKLSQVISQTNNIEDLTLQTTSFQEQGESSCILKNQTNLISLAIILDYRGQLDQVSLSQLFADISHNSNLKSLKFDLQINVKYDEQALQAVGNCFSQLANLNSLTFLLRGQDLKMDEQGLLYILSGMHALSKLEELRLELKTDKIRFETYKQLFMLVNNNQQLKVLNLKISGKNYLSESEQKELNLLIRFPPKIEELIFMVPLEVQFKKIENLFIEISQLQYLTTLELPTGNLMMANDDILKLAEYFKHLRLLTFLMLDNNSFNIIYLHHLFQSIYTLEFINYNLFFGEELAVANSIRQVENKSSLKQQNGNQQILGVEENIQLEINNQFLFTKDQLSYKEFDFIPLIFKNLKNLTTLSLVLPQVNSLTQEVVTILFLSFRNLLNLKELSLIIETGNQIGTEGVSLLGNILYSLPVLKKLTLRIDAGCNIIWRQAHEFYESIGKLKSLSSLSISTALSYNFQHEKEQEFLIQSLFRNIRFLQNLTELKINLGSIFYYHSILEDLLVTFSQLSDNLRSLTLQYDLKNMNIKDEILFFKVFLQLKGLQYLVLNKYPKTNIIKKLMRLVQIKIKFEF